MKTIVSLVLICAVVLFSCTDRDDNLEGVQIRVQNTTGATFVEVVIDSLVFAEVQPDEMPFYQKYNGNNLPQRVVLRTDSLNTTVNVDGTFEIDSTLVNLFTYRIKGINEGTPLEIEVIKD